MIRRSRIVEKDDKRTLTRRAWWPCSFEYGGEHVWIWLEQYVVEQHWTHGQFCSHPTARGWHWHTDRVLTLVDAALEKLNSVVPEAPQPVNAQLSQSALQALLAAQQGQPNVYSKYLQQMTGLGGTP